MYRTSGSAPAARRAAQRGRTGARRSQAIACGRSASNRRANRRVRVGRPSTTYAHGASPRGTAGSPVELGCRLPRARRRRPPQRSLRGFGRRQGLSDAEERTGFPPGNRSRGGLSEKNRIHHPRRQSRRLPARGFGPRDGRGTAEGVRGDSGWGSRPKERPQWYCNWAFEPKPSRPPRGRRPLPGRPVWKIRKRSAVAPCFGTGISQRTRCGRCALSSARPSRFLIWPFPISSRFPRTPSSPPFLSPIGRAGRGSKTPIRPPRDSAMISTAFLHCRRRWSTIYHHRRSWNSLAQ